MPKPELSTFKAVISPCSTCTNYNTDASTGLPLCPRRFWLEQKKAADAGGNCATPPDYLLESGTEQQDQYSNPVYSQNTSSVIVWVAALFENLQTLQSDGSPLTGSILDPGFDTKYIRCRDLPVHPDESWAGMIHRGTWKEMDQLIVHPMSTENQQQSGVLNDSPSDLQFGGVARKTNFAFNFNLVSPTSDRICSGT